MTFGEFLKSVGYDIIGFLLFIFSPIIGVKTQAEVIYCEEVGTYYQPEVGRRRDALKIGVTFETKRGRNVQAYSMCSMSYLETSILNTYLTGGYSYPHMKEQHILMVPIYYNRFFPKHVKLRRNADEVIYAYKKEIETIPNRTIDSNRVVTKNLLYLVGSAHKGSAAVLDCVLHEGKENNKQEVTLEVEITSGDARGRVLTTVVTAEEKFLPYLQGGCRLDIYYDLGGFERFAIAIPESVAMAN